VLQVSPLNDQKPLLTIRTELYCMNFNDNTTKILVQSKPRIMFGKVFCSRTFHNLSLNPWCWSLRKCSSSTLIP